MLDPTIAATIIYGSIVSMMCVGLTLTYLTTKVPNFAHSDFVVTGIYATAMVYILGRFSSPYLALPFGFLVGGLVAVAMYLLVIKPLTKRGSSLVVLMIATLAVDIVFTGLVALFINFTQSGDKVLLENAGYSLLSLSQLPDFTILGEQALLITAPTVLVVMTAALYLLLTRTKFGIAMRAAIENPNLSRTVGINVDAVYLVSWFIAGAIAGLAGGFYSIWAGTPQGSSSLLIVDIFAGSVLGGLSSIYGGIIGGLIVGAAETYITGNLGVLVSSFYGPSAGAQVIYFQKGIPLAIMITVLLIAPQGLVAINWRKVFRRKK